MRVYFEIQLSISSVDCDLTQFECDFIFDGVRVYTTENDIIFKDIQGCSEVANHIEAAARFRPKIISIIDIISFLIGDSITIYDIESQSYGIKFEEEVREKSDNIFIYKNVDFRPQLEQILLRIEIDKFTTLSLLDKWNKANFLLNEDDSHVLYLDEALINYFNIIEILADTTKKEYEKYIDEQSVALLNEFYTNIGNLDQNKIQEKINQKKKFLKEILVGEFLSLSDKFKYFLRTHKLLDDNLSYFVDKIIKIRNSLAHGRVVHNLSLMEYPLSPFYNIVSAESHSVLPIILLTGFSISKYIGINIWENEWEEIKKQLEPPPTLVADFLKDKIIVDINSANKYNLTWYSLFLYYLTCKTRERKEIELRVKFELGKFKFEDLDFQNLYEISVILINTKDDELYQLLSKVIIEIINNQYYRWLDYKDIFMYLEFRNIKVDIIREKIKEILDQ